MERLAHIIQREVLNGACKPIILSRGGPQISNLFFADDLFLFREASSEQIGMMRSCLEQFCLASTHKVSLEKSRLFVSRNVHHARASQLSVEACISLTSDLGKYFGVPLLHRRTNKDTHDFLLRSSQQRLASWKAASFCWSCHSSPISDGFSSDLLYANNGSSEVRLQQIGEGPKTLYLGCR